MRLGKRIDGELTAFKIRIFFALKIYIICIKNILLCNIHKLSWNCLSLIVLTFIELKNLIQWEMIWQVFYLVTEFIYTYIVSVFIQILYKYAFILSCNKYQFIAHITFLNWMKNVFFPTHLKLLSFPYCNSNWITIVVIYIAYPLCGLPVRLLCMFNRDQGMPLNL